MQIDLKNDGIDKLYVKAYGRMDLDNAVEYGTLIKDTIEDSEEKISDLTLDFAEITFISSFGLKEQGSMKLVNVSDSILGSFKIVGFDKFLVIE